MGSWAYRKKSGAWGKLDCAGLRLTRGQLSRQAWGTFLPPHASQRQDTPIGFTHQSGSGRWLLAKFE